MTRPKPRAPYDLDLTTDVDERLDEIAGQVRNVADTLRDTIEAVGSGDMPVDHLGPPATRGRNARARVGARGGPATAAAAMIAERELWDRAVEILQRNAVHTPASCVHSPYTKGPNPACESCRVYPLSPNLPDHKNPLRGFPGGTESPE